MVKPKEPIYDTLKFMAMAAWLSGYASGLPEPAQKEKDKIQDAAEMLLEIFRERNNISDKD